MPFHVDTLLIIGYTETKNNFFRFGKSWTCFEYINMCILTVQTDF